MTKLSDITVDVNARLIINDEMANRCLRLLEMWQEDNPDAVIICDSDNGKMRFSIQRRKYG